MPNFICPNCKERSVDIDRKEGLFDEAVACHHCGFGFLFELMDDYYPVQPSFEEGFGLPVLEAMCCSALVIASNVSSVPEVLGADVVAAFGLAGFEAEKNPVKLSLEWGVRRLNEQLQLRTRGGQVKRVIGDFFPALDDDGGLLVALTPAHS